MLGISSYTGWAFLSSIFIVVLPILGYDDNSIAPFRLDETGLLAQYIFTALYRALCGDTVLYCLPCYCSVYMLLVCVIMCCISFNLALKATSRGYDMLRPCFACCLFCFVFYFPPLRTTPRPSRSKKVVRTSGPMVPRVRCGRAAPQLSFMGTISAETIKSDEYCAIVVLCY